MLCSCTGMLLPWIITNMVYQVETYLHEIAKDLMLCTELLVCVSMKWVVCFYMCIFFMIVMGLEPHRCGAPERKKKSLRNASVC